ncbi:hypothetical protein BGZ83_008736 [Gryganskiella cystojenkinii]|nr:hypothetical protein BGZ83_008736 [Gryganskiella cystojenkinii]
MTFSRQLLTLTTVLALVATIVDTTPIFKREENSSQDSQALLPFMDILTTVLENTLLHPSLSVTGSPITLPPPKEIGQDFTNWSCKVTAEHPRPVILLHGLIAPHFNSWNFLAEHLSDAGFCVFQLKYGLFPGIDNMGGILDIRDSSTRIPDYIDKVLASTEAQQVDMVAHSEGGTVARWYLKYVAKEEPRKVRSLVSVSPIGDGTSVQGLVSVFKVFGLYDFFSKLIMKYCVPCLQLLEGSEFMAELFKDGEVLIPGVRMLNIMTKEDTLVTPYTRGKVHLSGNRDDSGNELVRGMLRKQSPANTTQSWEQEQLNRLDLQPGDIQNLFVEDYCKNSTLALSHFSLFRSDFTLHATETFLSPMFDGSFSEIAC